MIIIKPLYGLAEAGTHWWSTYSNHHKNKLQMVTSTYDPCLLVSTGTNFGIVGMQTDDTIMLADEDFAATEEREIARSTLIYRSKWRISILKELS